jgi:hypothetical protein
MMVLLKERLSIPYIKLKFNLIFIENTMLPRYKVSALRGGMGEMLLQSNCIRDRECRNCPYVRACIVRKTVYTDMKKKPAFMTGDDSIGYLIECENYQVKIHAGDRVSFTLTLFGESLVYFNQYLQAFYQLGLQGIGKEHSKYQIESVWNHKNQPIVQGNQVYMEYYQPDTVYEYICRRRKQMEDGLENKMVFSTPLSLKYRGKYLNRFSSEAICQALSRRVFMYDYFIENYIEKPVFQKYPKIIDQIAEKRCVRRYSSTQNQKMDMYGIQGMICFDEIEEELLYYLLAGEILHIGRDSSFGFGKYNII